MLKEKIMKNSHFEEVAEVKVDSKNRITLGTNRRRGSAKIYKVYFNDIGQIILDPQVTIPAYEQWIFKNKKAKRLIQQGLDDAKEGRLVSASEDYSKYIND